MTTVPGPRRPALIVVDMQNGFVHDDGFFARTGLDHRAGAATVGPIGRLIDAARAARVPVVFTRYSLDADYGDAGRLIDLWPAIREQRGLIRGSWDAALLDELIPAPDEPVIDKTRYSAFWGTDLRQRLDALGVDGVIVCGVTTNVCVEATARDAFAHDLHVTVVSDATAAATADLHTSSLRSLEYGAGRIATTADVVAELASSPR